jgi:hypothetical protein
MALNKIEYTMATGIHSRHERRPRRPRMRRNRRFEIAARALGEHRRKVRQAPAANQVIEYLPVRAVPPDDQQSLGVANGSCPHHLGMLLAH